MWYRRLSYKHYREYGYSSHDSVLWRDFKEQSSASVKWQYIWHSLINHLGVWYRNQQQKTIWVEAFCLNRDLKAKHLAGKLNHSTDKLSKSISSYKWQFHPNIFRLLHQIWGPHTCDRFASTTTMQKKRRYFYPLTYRVDALAQTAWGQENNYVNIFF